MVPDGYPVRKQQPVRPSVPQPGGAGRDIGESSLRVDVVEQNPDLHGAHAPRIEPQGEGGQYAANANSEAGTRGDPKQFHCTP